MLEYGDTRDRRRLRRDVPRRADARHRRRDPRRDLPPDARRPLPRRSSSPTATRTTSARCRTCWARSPVPVYGTPLTLGFVRERLREHDLPATLVRLRHRARSASAPFAVEPFAVTHSIPDAVGLVDPHARRHRRPHRRFQARPDAARRPPARPRPSRRARRRGRAAAALRLDQRRAVRGSPRRSGRVGAQLERIFREADGTRPRHDLLVAHPPHAAGDRRGRAARPPGGAGRPEPRLAQRGGARPRPAARPRRRARRSRGGARPAAGPRSRSSRRAARRRPRRRWSGSRWTPTSR